MAVKSVADFYLFQSNSFLNIARSSTSVLLKNPIMPTWPLTKPPVSTFAILLNNNVRTFAYFFRKKKKNVYTFSYTLECTYVSTKCQFLSHWIRHHAHMFDVMVMLDQGSTDSSVSIARAEAPRS